MYPPEAGATLDDQRQEVKALTKASNVGATDHLAQLAQLTALLALENRGLHHLAANTETRKRRLHSIVQKLRKRANKRNLLQATIEKRRKGRRATPLGCNRTRQQDEQPTEAETSFAQTALAAGLSILEAAFGACESPVPDEDKLRSRINVRP